MEAKRKLLDCPFRDCVNFLPPASYSIWWMAYTNYAKRWNFINKWGVRQYGIRIWRLVLCNSASEGYPPQLRHPNWGDSKP